MRWGNFNDSLFVFNVFIAQKCFFVRQINASTPGSLNYLWNHLIVYLGEENNLPEPVQKGKYIVRPISIASLDSEQIFKQNKEKIEKKRKEKKKKLEEEF